jgi:diacylglycerol kinase family enzyme
MKQVYVLFNPLSGNGCEQSAVEVLSAYFSDAEMHYRDITTMNNYGELLNQLAAEDVLVICGGDGTLNRFVNQTYDMELSVAVYYYPTGSGNDFLRDLGKCTQDGPVQINEYINNLPCVRVKGKTYRFLNGVGYGIDGYCCEVGEQLRKAGKKPDYTAIAIKGLLFHYRPTNATVNVDGVEHRYKRVWIAPTMHGRYYGGGMMPAPHQKRNNPEGLLSLMLMHNAGKIGTLCVFPSIFKGKHIDHKKKVDLHMGHDITVKFDRPVTLQIDGETVTEVSEYHAYSKVPAKVK